MGDKVITAKTGPEARRHFRKNDCHGPTSGVAPDFVPGDLAIPPIGLAG